MRKVTETIVDAFLGRTPANAGNSSTDGDTLFLHGNRIAWHGEQNGAAGVFLTLAGWDTVTTKERLRGVLRMMGHMYTNLGTRPVLQIWTVNGQTKIGEGSAKALDLDPNATVFVVHPVTSVGLPAISLVA